MNKHIAVLVAVSLALGACSSNTKPDLSKVSPDTSKAPKMPQIRDETEVGKANETNVVASKLDENKQLEKSIYFDFDSSIEKPEFRKVILEQTEYLKANNNETLTLIGNCDERGSAEYNLALGQRRAQEISHQLQILGIPKERISVISDGKEKPLASCHEEKCWQENRRVDFVHNNS